MPHYTASAGGAYTKAVQSGKKETVVTWCGSRGKETSGLIRDVLCRPDGLLLFYPPLPQQIEKVKKT